MPVKNGSSHINSIFPQILANVSDQDEILIIDDGSTDDTPNLLEALQDKYNQEIRIIRTSGVGLVGALNLGMKNALGDWIARYDADDSYSSNRIILQKQFIRENTVGVFSDYQLEINGEKKAGRILSPLTPLFTKLSFFAAQQTAHPIAFLRKEAVIAAGMYFEEDFPAEDLGLWLRMSKLGEIVSVPQILLFYNLNPNGISLSNQKLMKNMRMEVLARYKEGLITQSELDSSFMNEWIQIDRSTHTLERKIMASRNLFIAKSILKFKIRKKILVKIFIQIFRLKTIFVLSEMVYYQNVRKKARTTKPR